MTTNNNSVSFNNIKIENAKILLLMENNRNADLLSKFLDSNHLTFNNIKENNKYDLILADNFNYQINYTKIKKLKDDQLPILLPVILLHKRDDVVDYTSKMINIIDEYVLTPVKKDVLRSRIRSLLKTRQLTIKSFHQNDKYQKIFNNINVMLLIHKIDFENKEFYNFDEYNNIVIKKLGYDKNNILKMKLTDIVNHNMKSPFYNYYFNKLASNGEVSVLTEIKTNDGKLLKAQLYSKILEINNEKVILTTLAEIV
ncbi:MAG: hypothetical protein U5K53_08180 [Halanaerobiales bacterium]|nr:hypothetical protein [Halanaerobiales bacterium]